MRVSDIKCSISVWRFDWVMIILALAVGLGVGAAAGGTAMRHMVILEAKLAGCEVMP